MSTLNDYLSTLYRRNVLGQSVEVKTPMATPEQIAAAEAELARINKLGLGASLAQRDFVAYQNKRALEGLLASWKEEQANASETQATKV